MPRGERVAGQEVSRNVAAARRERRYFLGLFEVCATPDLLTHDSPKRHLAPRTSLTPY